MSNREVLTQQIDLDAEGVYEQASTIQTPKDAERCAMAAVELAASCLKLRDMLIAPPVKGVRCEYVPA